MVLPSELAAVVGSIAMLLFYLFLLSIAWFVIKKGVKAGILEAREAILKEAEERQREANQE